jgi:hypothetical protein
MGTANIHRWSQLYGKEGNKSKGVNEVFNKNDSNKREWKDAVTAI